MKYFAFLSVELPAVKAAYIAGATPVDPSFMTLQRSMYRVRSGVMVDCMSVLMRTVSS